MVTLQDVNRLEVETRSAFYDAFDYLNFPYDLDVRFGTLEREVLRDPRGAFVEQEYERLKEELRNIKKAGDDLRSYKKTYRR